MMKGAAAIISPKEESVSPIVFLCFASMSKPDPNSKAPKTIIPTAIAFIIFPLPMLLNVRMIQNNGWPVSGY